MILNKVCLLWSPFFTRLLKVRKKPALTNSSLSFPYFLCYTWLFNINASIEKCDQVSADDEALSPSHPTLACSVKSSAGGFCDTMRPSSALWGWDFPSTDWLVLTASKALFLRIFKLSPVEFMEVNCNCLASSKWRIHDDRLRIQLMRWSTQKVWW